MTAYNAFLLAAYGTDADGLADLAGIDRTRMRRHLNKTDYRDMSAGIVEKLGMLTGISFAWLFAEDCEVAR